MLDIAVTAATLKSILNSNLANRAMDMMSTAKKQGDKDKTIEAYESFFANLIDENQQLKVIALAYKDEYEQINLREEDIEYLHKTAARLINVFSPKVTDDDKLILKEQGHSEEAIAKHVLDLEKQRSNFEEGIELIQVDTLRTMQLLGFNYKQAIGEPLTKIVSQLILNTINSENSENIE